MQDTTPLPAVLPKAAATLVLLRDDAKGAEVLLLKRHGLSDVLGEAHVFPGGKVDASDLGAEALSLLEESPAALRERLGEPDCEDPVAGALFVAAIREAFEESSILMGAGATQLQCEQAASQLRGGASFLQVMTNLGVKLASSQLVPWSRWVTPTAPQLQAKRFDARFFVARLPSDAVALHDGHETTEAVWMTPRDALERNWKREISLAPPQIMTMVHMAMHADVRGILDDARRRAPYLIEPHVLQTPEGVRLCYPGDPAHPVAQRRMPGPLRLAIRDKRYEPLGGFEEFFQ
ncbi:NUDIX hydrolase [Variovorax paradoxus]|nr:NUDIX hydrolase [Variovorax paradoxus]MBT2301953.1 NUDIX hydrolase [Variovorax paradoxus]